MFSAIYKYFFESSEDRLNKFRVILCSHRAELAKIQREATYSTRNFINYLKNSKIKDDIEEKANELNYLYKRCEAYEKIANAGTKLIQKWELFDQSKQENILINKVLYDLHYYSYYLEEKEMMDWIAKAPCPDTIPERKYEEVTNSNIDKFIDSFFKPFDFTYDVTNHVIVEKKNLTF